MIAIQAFIVISAVLIAIITYSALVISSKQEQRMVKRVKESKKLEQNYYSTRDSFGFEISEDLIPEEEDTFYDSDDF